MLGALVGCEGRATRITGEVDWDPPPVARTPADAVRILVWSWNHQDTTRYASVLTADFEFAFAADDTFGSLFPGRVLNRALELAAVRSLFFTGTDQLEPPQSVVLLFEGDLIALPDSRPAKNARRHREIAASARLRLYNPDFELSSTFRMFLMRGDVVAWPSGVPHGPAPDSTRWFVERWEEESFGSDTAASRLPGRSPTMGQIKALYLGRNLGPQFAIGVRSARR